MRFIIFGPPGSGKGTYASRMAPRLGISHIALGEILRQIVKEEKPLAQKVKKYLAAGTLAPDKLVIELLKKKLEGKKGFILDGFPRTIEQAKALAKITKIEAIFNINVHQEILVEKISSRRTCRVCGNLYNLADIKKTIEGREYFLPPMLPKVEGRCDICGGELYQREDDKPEIIRKRLKVYETQSQPVIGFYEGKVPFIQIFMTRPPEEIVEKAIADIKAAGLL